MAKHETAAAPKSALTWKHKVGYGLGDLGGCMTFALMGGYVTRYYVKVLEVNNLILATLLLIWNIWDAVNDPLMGALMDKLYAKHHNKRGKFRPWLLRSAPLLAITAVIFWTVPTFFEGTAMLCVLFICKILYEGCYTMFNIPMGSLLSAMAKTDEERASLSSARGFGSTVGNLLPMMIFPAILQKFGDANPKGYAIGAAVCAALGFVFCFLHYYWTEERNVSDAPSQSAEETVKFTDIFTVFKKNRAYLALCIHGVCICCMQYVGNTLGTFMYADVLGSIGLMGKATLVSMPMSIIVLVVSPKLAKKFGLTEFIRASLLVGFGLYVSLFAAHMLTDVNPYVHMVWSSVAMSVAMVSILMQWGMVGEAIDYNEMVTGKRSEGSMYGTFNLSRRIGQTVGNSAAVLALGWIGYDNAAAVQAASTITGIKVLCVLVPGIFAIGSWAAFKFVWNINDETRAKLNAFIAAKDAKSEE